MHNGTELGPITRDRLLNYFLGAAKAPGQWQVGMEVERIARHAQTGRPLPYEGATPSIRGILEFYRDRRGGNPIWEATHLIGLDGPWGSITLEPGGQVEWSSRPAQSLAELHGEMKRHLETLEEASLDLGFHWIDRGVDPALAVDDMIWMPKARYNIMRPFLGARGRLAHRMMTQTASIQCAFDYTDPSDWLEKFRTASWLAPVATALFANSSELDGGPSGYENYRQAIWRETDPARCSLPAVVFEPDFGIEAWLDWILQVPTIFRHRARGLVPSGGIRFAELMNLSGCDAIRPEDWETHVSTIFTEVRSYTYIEVRSADLQMPQFNFAVPTFWSGLLYDDQSRQQALELGERFATYDSWTQAMDEASRKGLGATIDGESLQGLAETAVRVALEGLARLPQRYEVDDTVTEPLRQLAERRQMVLCD